MNDVGSDQPDQRPQRRPRRIVLTAVGSLGDLHPYIAIALGLKARGHEAVVATSACYRQKVEALGLGFRPLRPDSAFVTDPAVMPTVHAPPLGHHPVYPGVDPAGAAGVLRGHAGGSGRCRPAGLALDRLRHPARRRDDRHPLGLHDHHADRSLLGIRPAVDAGLSRGLEDAPSPGSGVLGTGGEVPQVGDPLDGRPLVSSPQGTRAAALRQGNPLVDRPLPVPGARPVLGGAGRQADRLAPADARHRLPDLRPGR